MLNLIGSLLQGLSGGGQTQAHPDAPGLIGGLSGGGSGFTGTPMDILRLPELNQTLWGNSGGLIARLLLGESGGGGGLF